MTLNYGQCLSEGEISDYCTEVLLQRAGLLDTMTNNIQYNNEANIQQLQQYNIG